MTLKKAQKLVQQDVSLLSKEELQSYKVALLDAWRYAKGDYGNTNDFFVYVDDLRAYVPADKWLLQNVNKRLDEILGV